MIVKVTQEHIDKGKRIDCNHCPVALALLDVFKVKTVNVGAFDLRIGSFPDDLIFTVPTPSLVTKFINHFDEGKFVEPFEFKLFFRRSKIVIVKIQWPITTTEEIPQMLIYNKDRSFQTTWPATKEYERFFKNRLKFYVHAKFEKGELILGKEEKNPKLIDW